MDKTELKPCPFCGGKALTKRSCAGVHVICSKCLITEVYETYEEAVEKWNARHSAWIPCSERLPDDYKKVLIYGKETGVLIGFFTSYKNLYISDNGNTATRISAITHWMPLPEPPEMDGCESNA